MNLFKLTVFFLTATASDNNPLEVDKSMLLEKNKNYISQYSKLRDYFISKNPLENKIEDFNRKVDSFFVCLKSSKPLRRIFKYNTIVQIEYLKELAKQERIFYQKNDPFLLDDLLIEELYEKSLNKRIFELKMISPEEFNKNKAIFYTFRYFNRTATRLVNRNKKIEMLSTEILIGEIFKEISKHEKIKDKLTVKVTVDSAIKEINSLFKLKNETKIENDKKKTIADLHKKIKDLFDIFKDLQNKLKNDLPFFNVANAALEMVIARLEFATFILNDFTNDHQTIKNTVISYIKAYLLFSFTNACLTENIEKELNRCIKTDLILAFDEKKLSVLTDNDYSILCPKYDDAEPKKEGGIFNYVKNMLIDNFIRKRTPKIELVNGVNKNIFLEKKQKSATFLKFLEDEFSTEKEFVKENDSEEFKEKSSLYMLYLTRLLNKIYKSNFATQNTELIKIFNDDKNLEKNLAVLNKCIEMILNGTVPVKKDFHLAKDLIRKNSDNIDNMVQDLFNNRISSNNNVIYFDILSNLNKKDNIFSLIVNNQLKEFTTKKKGLVTLDWVVLILVGWNVLLIIAVVFGSKSNSLRK